MDQIETKACFNKAILGGAKISKKKFTRSYKENHSIF